MNLVGLEIQFNFILHPPEMRERERERERVQSTKICKKTPNKFNLERHIN